MSPEPKVERPKPVNGSKIANEGTGARRVPLPPPHPAF